LLVKERCFTGIESLEEKENHGKTEIEILEFIEKKNTRK
jgi:hypothetical protein